VTNSAPIITLIHGFLGRSCMRAHLLKYLREDLHADATMFGYLHSISDMGTDRRYQDNLAIATSPTQQIENRGFAKRENISHMGLTRCYPASSVHPLVKSEILRRIQSELQNYAQFETY
jgi:hypothetical protein